MDDQVRISLLVARVGPVVVDTMAVEGQRRIAKQERSVWLYTAAPLRHAVVTLRCRCSHRTRRRGFTIDDVLLLGDAGRAIATDRVLNGYERQRAALARLVLYFQDAAASRCLPLDGQRGKIANAT